MLTILVTTILLLAAATIAEASSRPARSVDRALHHAAAVYHVSYWQLRSVSWCESRWNPNAVNRASVGGEHSSGLFQFLPSTFSHTPYARRSIFSAWWNALAAAWLVRHDGGWGEWSCRP